MNRCDKMEITQTAKENKEKNLPNQKTSLEETDPELLEIMDNFIFDETQQHNTLTYRTTTLITLAALITNQSQQLYMKILEGAIDNGIKPIEIKEVLYQTIPYAGLSKVYDFIDLTNQVLDEKGVDVPLPGQSTTNRNNRKEKGYQIQTQYFGKENIDAMKENALKNQEHLYDFLESYCFGDFYTRTGLDDKDREIITFSIIASLRGCENQLRGHTGGNLSVGNTKEDLISAVTVLLPYNGFPRTLNALAIINEICDAQ